MQKARLRANRRESFPEERSLASELPTQNDRRASVKLTRMRCAGASSFSCFWYFERDRRNPELRLSEGSLTTRLQGLKRHTTEPNPADLHVTLYSHPYIVDRISAIMINQADQKAPIFPNQYVGTQTNLANRKTPPLPFPPTVLPRSRSVPAG